MITDEGNIHPTGSATDVENVTTSYVPAPKKPRNLRWTSRRQEPFTPYQLQSSGSVFWVAWIFLDFIHRQNRLPRCATCNHCLLASSMTPRFAQTDAIGKDKPLRW